MAESFQLFRSSDCMLSPNATTNLVPGAPDPEQQPDLAITSLFDFKLLYIDVAKAGSKYFIGKEN